MYIKCISTPTPTKHSRETREAALTISGSRDKTPTPRTVSLASLVKSVKSATVKTVGLPINRA
ncbi:hypothetical protein E2986_10717 [Frieseomelitta varia]|uniref:Uncharacterized protein n=1 Tax=Frieseomelitta varia TaxID=561572 RepID=A0A833SFM1_9HYME|nr:hypothetical protein E2986_10717 [Frieseomelitta varia]